MIFYVRFPILDFWYWLKPNILVSLKDITTSQKHIFFHILSKSKTSLFFVQKNKGNSSNHKRNYFLFHCSLKESFKKSIVFHTLSYVDRLFFFFFSIQKFKRNRKIISLIFFSFTFLSAKGSTFVIIPELFPISLWFNASVASH